MEDITNVDYTHTKRVCKDFEIKYVGYYQDLYVPSDILLLVQAALEKTFSKSRSFNWYWYVISGRKRY